MRRALTILSILIVLGGAGAAAYFYYFGSTAGVEVAAPTDTSLPSAGNAEVPVPGSETTAPTTPVSAPTTVSARLVQISKGPVVPGVVVMNKTATASSSAETEVRYIERQSGNVYSYSTKSGSITRISNRTVPGIQSALWLPDGSTAFIRYLSGADFSTVNSYALPSNGTGGFFLAQDLSDLAVSSAGILSLSSGVNGSIASLSRADGTRVTQLFTTPLSQMRVSFAGPGKYLAYTSPSAALPGAAYLVDGTGTFSRAAGPLFGLVAKASPAGKWVLASFTFEGSLRMMLVNAATGEKINLPVATIADKCVWTADETAVYCGVPVDPSSGARYPDDWYQGAVPFSDRIWKIQVDGRYAQFVLDFGKENGSSVDVLSPAIDPAGTTLVFINKNDGALWIYSL